MNDDGRSPLYKAVRIFRLLYPHLTFILSVMFIVFWILDRFNPVMGFLTGSISRMLMILFFVLVFLGSVVSILLDVYRIGEKKRPNGRERQSKR